MHLKNKSHNPYDHRINSLKTSDRLKHLTVIVKLIEWGWDVNLILNY